MWNMPVTDLKKFSVFKNFAVVFSIAFYVLKPHKLFWELGGQLFSKVLFSATFKFRIIEGSPESKHLNSSHFAQIFFFFFFSFQFYLLASFTKLISLPLKAGHWSYYAMFSCSIHKDKSFHCEVCNVCHDKHLQGKHKCRPDCGHNECCICLKVS